ncbi:MAG: hypothetical protein PHO37_06355 [Kiritimatiellae bacterium]|nr:hypothetical protein [Kiritimatiellia bacterium]
MNAKYIRRYAVDVKYIRRYAVDVKYIRRYAVDHHETQPPVCVQRTGRQPVFLPLRHRGYARLF